MEHLTQLHEAGLNFSCVVMDAWYFNKVTAHIEKMDKDWVASVNQTDSQRVNGRL